MDSKTNGLEHTLLNPESLLPQAQHIVELAKKRGADFADALISTGKDISIDVEKNSIKSTEASIGSSISIRVYINGGLGYISANNIENIDPENLVEKAIELAKIATPDPDFISLPTPEQPSYIPTTFDDKILSITPKQVINWITENIKEAQSTSKNVIVSGGAGFSITSAAIASSTGINIAKNSTNIHIGFFCIVSDGKSIGSFADHSSARFLQDFHPDGLAKKVTIHAQKYLNQQKTSTKRTTLILAPQATASFIASIASLANAESIQRRRSLLADKFNQTIASEIFTLTDNGLIDRGLASSAYDAEGATRKPVTIIENGKFTGQLHNSYTANKAKTQNTGHGTRTGGISPSNLQLRPGDIPAEKIIRETEDGVYLELGGLSPDPVSGDISTNLDFAFKIEGGELAYPLANTMVAGNLLDMLKNIDAISSDYREEPGNIFPTIRIRDVQISSANF